MSRHNAQDSSVSTGQNVPKIGPGKWIEKFLDEKKSEVLGLKHTLGAYGEEFAASVLQQAQDRVSSHSVIIGATGKVETGVSPKEMTPGTGVVVKIRGNSYGVLTAGHVLKRPGSTKEEAGVTIVACPRGWDRDGTLLRLEISPRSYTVNGFDNVVEEGPDIAIIPLTNGEWNRLNNGGVVAYNLDKKRWSTQDRAAVRKMKPCLISIITGVRCEPSEIMSSHRGDEKSTFAITTANTQLQPVPDRNGHDYIELPLEVTEESYPTTWNKTPPKTAAEEIEELYDEGVTRRVWGGVSGAGVWNVAVETNSEGTPHGRVLVELAGICFFANNEKECIVAHGTESIRKIATKHLENEALRFHREA